MLYLFVFPVDLHKIRHKIISHCEHVDPFLASKCVFFFSSCVSDTDKEKLGVGDSIDLLGGGSDMGPSAALTPAIWNKTIPYDGENFHLEYMDIEEFLIENGIPTMPDEDSPDTKTEKIKRKGTKSANVSSLALMPIQDLDKSDKELLIITKSDSDIICDVTTGE